MPKKPYKCCIDCEVYNQAVQNKPDNRITIEQVAYIFDAITTNSKCDGTFRHLIYNILGFGPDAYEPLYKAGGMYITNGLNKAYGDNAISDWEIID